MARLEERVTVANVPRRRIAHSTDQAGTEIGQDVAEHVFGDQNIEIPWATHQIERRCIDGMLPSLDHRIGSADLEEQFSHKGKRTEDICLVDYRDRPRASATGTPAVGQFETEARQPFGYV